MTREVFWYVFFAFIAFDFLLLIFVLWRKLKTRRIFGVQKKYLNSQWEIVKKLFVVDSKSALIEADKLLDYAMKLAFNNKFSVGQNLKANGKIFTDLNGIWYVHKLRNQLVHQLSFKLKARDISLAKTNFYQALKDLGM